VQRIARAEQEPGARRVPLAEPPDQSRLADAGLAHHQHDTAGRGGRGQHIVQLRQQRGTLEQVHYARRYALL
jgi:hypothetical protein